MVLALSHNPAQTVTPNAIPDKPIRTVTILLEAQDTFPTKLMRCPPSASSTSIYHLFPLVPYLCYQFITVDSTCQGFVDII